MHCSDASVILLFQSVNILHIEQKGKYCCFKVILLFQSVDILQIEQKGKYCCFKLYIYYKSNKKGKKLTKKSKILPLLPNISIRQKYL